MSDIVSLILPSTFEIYKNADGQALGSLNPLSKINIFVGSNNSGKSRFMRLIAMQDSYEIHFSDVDVSLVNRALTKVLNSLKMLLHRYGVFAANEVSIQKIDELSDLPDSLSTTTDNYSSLRNTLQDWSLIENINRSSGNGNVTGSGKFLSELVSSCREGLEILDGVPQYNNENNPKRIYVPILRGLRPLDDKHTDFYHHRTKTDYFHDVDVSRQPEIFSGLTFYQRLTDLLLGTNSERKTIAKYQEFISDTLFEGRSVTLIPSPKNKVVTVKIGKEADRPIYELGDGIQSAIILSFLPYVTKEATFFFIEEPESHLHPGLQRKLLSFFATRQNHHFFLTAHSNHLLDVTIDIKDLSIFTFRKHIDLDADDDDQSPSFSIENVDATHSSSLELLGVRNSSVFMVNATVWVEGITDRWYLRAMLNSYMEHLATSHKLPLRVEEDVHYCFVEYGGSNITHWSFLDHEEHPIEVERLCARALVIVDEDGQTKLQRKEKLQENLGERLITLPCREIENTLPYDLIKEVVLDYENTPEKNLPDFKYEDYRNEYLGHFIEDKILKGEKARKGSYAAPSGTISDKVNFCEIATKKIIYSKLPEATQNIVQKIYRFICEMNT